MITIFNRKELITVVSTQKLYAVEQALSGAGIPYHAKAGGAHGFAIGRGRGVPFVDQENLHPYSVYVLRRDYDRARRAIQPALRDT